MCDRQTGSPDKPGTDAFLFKESSGRLKVPAYVFWFDAFPMNASGKIDLKELRREAAARAAKQREACEAH